MSRRDWLFALGLIVLTLFVYAPAWNGKPIWDDETHLTVPELRSLHGLERIWTDPGAAPQYYPVLHTVFWLEYRLWGDWPLPYHVVNILLHAACAVLLAKILQHLEVPGSWLAAAIFALHPVQVESVAWMAELKNTLSGALCLGAAYAYIRFDRDRRRRQYAIALTLFLIGLMVKSVIAPLPAALLVVFWWKKGNLEWKRDVKPLLPFFVTGIGAGLFTAWVERTFCGASGLAFNLSLLDRSLIAARAFWFYLAKLFWPQDLIMIYPRWTIDPTIWWQYIFPLGIVLLVLVLWILRRQSRPLIAALLVFVLMLAPMLSFLNIAYFSISFVADHFQYLASIGIISVVAAGFTTFLHKFQMPGRVIGYTVCLTLVGILAGLSWAQSHNYEDAEVFFRTVVAKNPKSPTAHSNLGSLFLNRGLIDKAISEFQQSIAIDPDYRFGRFNLGAALMQKGDADDAIPQLRAVLNQDPNYAKAYYVLGNALSKKGETNEAIASYQRAVRLQSDFPDAECNLANLLLEQGKTEEALVHYRKAAEIQPDNPGAHYNLAVGLVRNGEPEPAINELRIALRLDPAYPDAEPLLLGLLRQKNQR